MITVIKNNGLVDVEAFTLLGASTKRDEKNKIGMFGSGNKYAIAYFIRNGYKVRIFRGHEEIIISTVEKTFKEKTFKVICFNGKETSITTETGPEWTFWQSMRELYSNAIDEGGERIYRAEKYELVRGVTTIAVKDNGTETMKNFLDNIEDYFVVEKPWAFKNTSGCLFLDDPEKTVIYRKGIRCMTDEEVGAFLFSYNFNSLQISESRIYSSSLGLRDAIYRLLCSCDVPEIIQRYLRLVVNNNSIESDGFGFETHIFSDTWKKVLDGHFVAPIELGGWVENNIKNKTYLVPSSVYNQILAQFGESYNALKNMSGSYIKYRVFEPNESQISYFEEVLDHLSSCDYPIDHPIVFCDFNSERTLGLAEKKTIFLSRKLFEKGKFTMAKVIMHEAMHLDSGCVDESREFEDAIFDKLLNYMNSTHNRYL
jgi:hypothetical protein